MTFAYPKLLYLLLLLPAVFGLWYWARMARRNKVRRFGKDANLESLMPEYSRYKPAIKITLELLALAALIVALARPRHGEKEEVESTQGIEVMICFDVSRSMLASSTDDIKGISRLNRAKYLLGNLIDKLSNDKVGLIVFAGEAYTQLPITTDFISARMYLDELSTEMVSSQGTAIGTAINMAINSFSPAKDVNKAIIVITDGENHEGDAVEMAKYAQSLGIEVDVMGVGSIKGAPIPIGREGNFLKDENGSPVTTFLNEKMAKEIAQAGGGVYINGSSQKALRSLIDQLDKIKKSDLQRVSYKASAEQFPLFIWIALILLFIDAVVLPSKIGWLKGVSFFSDHKIAAKGARKVAAKAAGNQTSPADANGAAHAAGRATRPLSILLVLLALGGGLTSCSKSDADSDAVPTTKKERNFMHAGKRDFDQQRYAEAEVNFKKALHINSENPEAKFNLATSYLKQRGEDLTNKNDTLIREATKIFQEVAGNVAKPALREYSFYDLGNLAYKNEDYGNAIEMYKNALRVNPENDQVRQNLRLAQLKKNEQDQNQQNQNQNQQNQDNQDQNKDQQDQNKDQQDQQNQQDQQDQNQDQQDRNKDQQQQQQQQGGLSQQNAEQILKAMEDKESATRQKVEQMKYDKERQSQRRQTTKPW